MSDVTIRLRLSADATYDGRSELMHEAADEIERLRAAGDLRECDACGEMKNDVRTAFLPHVGDTSACEECRNPDKWRQRT